MQLNFLLLLVIVGVHHSTCYSAEEDAIEIAKYKYERLEKHARVARTLVHQSSWSAVGTISTDSNIPDYPMVNVIAVADGVKEGNSTGAIYFDLTDLDFTGRDFKADDRSTFLFSDDQMENCKRRNVDPMEPTCARTIISGHVRQLNENDPEYKLASDSFVATHPRAPVWNSSHEFYMCRLDIANIYVLNGYGGPRQIPVELYYSTTPFPISMKSKMADPVKNKSMKKYSNE